METLLTGLVILAVLLYFMLHKKPPITIIPKSLPPQPPCYPYRPDIERRLADGSITTDGYAAQHPAEFCHWGCGPENVMGETIDRTDWENWRVNYWGMDS